MALLNQPFDPNSVAPRDSFDAIPIGDYPMMFVSSEEKANKAKTGAYIELVAEIIDGPFKGRKIWERLNLVNPSTAAVEIAQATLSSICKAVNFTEQLNDSAQLHQKPFIGAVKIVPASGQHEASNEIKSYKLYAPNVAAPTTSAQAPAVAYGQETSGYVAPTAAQQANAQAQAQTGSPEPNAQPWKQPA